MKIKKMKTTTTTNGAASKTAAAPRPSSVVALAMTAAAAATLPSSVAAFAYLGARGARTTTTKTTTTTTLQSGPSQTRNLALGRLSPTFLQASKRGGGAMSRKKKSKKSGSGGGFGSTPSAEGEEAPKKESEDAPPSSSSTSTTTTKGGGGKSIYSLPALYDLAFGYRNYDEEVRFLLHAHRIHSSGGENDGDGGTRVLEMAAGPARHSLAALADPDNGVARAAAIDLSEDMVSYGNENADVELGTDGPRREMFEYARGDMRTFASEEEKGGGSAGDGNDDDDASSFDTAWILLGSMQHLTTNDDVISCFASAYRSLRPGGTLVVELPHPRETFSMVECTRNGWEVPLEDLHGDEYGELRIVWGDENDPFDPIRQVRDFTVEMELTGMEGEDEDEEMQNVKEVVPMRLFTAQEIDALGRCAGLEVVEMYGALVLDDDDDDDDDEEEGERKDGATTVDVNDEDEAFRLVCVLRKPQ